ncbi:MAG: TnpV protein [Planctomycetota bacterium]|nr:TnpV protein [Planctomycetota bacterium]
MKEHRPLQYSRLLLTEQLFPHLREVGRIADERRPSRVSESIIAKKALAKSNRTN